MISLMARMGLDTSGFTAGLKTAQAKMANARASFNAGAANLMSSQLAGMVGVTALVAGAKSIVDYGGKVTDLADKYGLTTDMVQQLSYAAGQTGVSVETALGGIKKVAIATADALGGNEEKMAAFERLGITAQQLRSMSPDQVFLALGNNLKDMPMTAQVFADINDTLGRSGQELIPMFREGLSGMMDDAKRLGVVMDEETIAKLDEMGDSAESAWGALRAAAAPVILFVMDGINKMFTGFKMISAEMEDLFTWATVSKEEWEAEKATRAQNNGGESVADQQIRELDEKSAKEKEARAARIAKRGADRAAALTAGAGVDDDKAGSKAAAKEETELAKLQKQIEDKRLARLPEEQRIAALQKELADAKRDAANTNGDGSVENLRAQLRVEELTDQVARASKQAPEKTEQAKLDSIQQIGGRVGENAAISNGQRQIKTLEDILKAVADGNANTAVLKP